MDHGSGVSILGADVPCIGDCSICLQNSGALISQHGEPRPLQCSRSLSSMQFDHQWQLLVRQEYLLLSPVLHVVVREFEFKAPEHFGQNQLHLSPCQAVEG